MKTKNIFNRVALACVAALAMAACGQVDGPQVEPTDGIDLSKIKFEVSMADKPDWNSLGGGAGTRAVKQGWVTGDVIVVYFDGTSQNRVFLEYAEGGEWQPKEGELYAFSGTVQPGGGTANALNALRLETVVSSDDEVRLVADRDLLYDDGGRYTVYDDRGTPTVRVTLTMNRRITSLIIVEGLDDPGQWTLDGPGLKPFRGEASMAFEEFETTWEATLSPLFPASYPARPTVGYVGQDNAAAYWVKDDGGADGKTTLMLTNTTTGTTWMRVYTGVGRDLVAGQTYVIQGPDGEEKGLWRELVSGSVVSVEVSPKSLKLVPGETQQMTATILPDDATNKTVTWSSDNEAVATVNPDTGAVTGVGEGTATITATTADGGLTDSGVIAVREYYEDKEIIQLQSATKGKAITIIFMGDGYTREHMKIGTGEYETVMRKGMDYFFKSDPICKYREYFNVWMVVGIGNEAGISIAQGTTTTAATNVDTAFGVLGRTGTATHMNFKGSSTNFEVRAEKALAYIDAAILVATGNTTRDHIVVVMPVNCSNTSNAWRGTAWMWAGPVTTPGFGICLMGVDKRDNWDYYGRLLTHEAVGHGFAQLQDEYQSNSGAATAAFIDRMKREKALGWRANVDVEVKARGGGIANTSWAEFANYPKYNATVGCYEGGFYKTGVWRSDAGKCCMNVNSYVFDAPSRWSLVQWVNRRAGIEGYTFEDFVVDDVIPAGLTRSGEWTPADNLPPIAPPVVFMDE